MSASQAECDLARIDREWESERERYLVTSRRGVRYVPSAFAAASVGGVAVAVGLLCTVMMFRSGGAATMGWFGLVFVAAAVVVCGRQFRKSLRYRNAYRAYQRRRAACLGQGERGASAP